MGVCMFGGGGVPWVIQRKFVRVRRSNNDQYVSYVLLLCMYVLLHMCARVYLCADVRVCVWMYVSLCVAVYVRELERVQTSGFTGCFELI